MPTRLSVIGDSKQAAATKLVKTETEIISHKSVATKSVEYLMWLGTVLRARFAMLAIVSISEVTVADTRSAVAPMIVCFNDGRQDGLDSAAKDAPSDNGDGG